VVGGVSVDLGDLGEVDDFDGGEGLEVEGRGGVAEGAQEVGVVGEGEGGMEAADDVEFGGAGVGGGASDFAGVVEVTGVGADVGGFAMELAEPAGEGADI